MYFNTVYRHTLLSFRAVLKKSYWASLHKCHSPLFCGICTRRFTVSTDTLCWTWVRANLFVNAYPYWTHHCTPNNFCKHQHLLMPVQLVNTNTTSVVFVYSPSSNSESSPTLGWNCIAWLILRVWAWLGRFTDVVTQQLKRRASPWSVKRWAKCLRCDIVVLDTPFHKSGQLYLSGWFARW